ncbi:MAG: ABC transporter ATP-binding protein [Isosphaeraceae bacterium]
MPPAIRIENLSKRYQVHHASPRGTHGYQTLRDALTNLALAPLRRLRGDNAASSGDEDFWALKDVGFEVEPGEVVGIIGRNGAGKSTLLKVLSRITKPTSGRVELRGRVGSLLEVGTGFHPELTGRENIFLTGSILGMTRAEIARKFDEIVAFSEVERFLDMPVKRYSSGMYVRLAFAVAASLQPEVLIVDEVLAVGDMAFQRKCLGRMREVGRSGCTVLFVSHNMPAIETLCTRAVLLDGGRVAGDGGVRELIAEYQRRVMGEQDGKGISVADMDAPGRRIKVYRAATLIDNAGEPTNYLLLGGTFRIRLTLDAPRPLAYPVLTLGIDDTLGHRLVSLCTPLARPTFDVLSGRCVVECQVEQFPLAPGEYWVKLGLATVGEEIDEVERALLFSVLDGDAFGEGRGIHRGVCVAPSLWSVQAVERADPVVTGVELSVGGAEQR